MRTPFDLWRRVSDQLRPRRPPAAVADEADEALLALTGQFEAGDHALRVLLEGDGRDTDDVPGFDALADRQAELVELIVATPAQSLAGVVSKARCARLRPSEQGFDAAVELALSASDDLLRLAGARSFRGHPFAQPPGPSRVRDVGTSEGTEEPLPVDSPGNARRLSILRRSGLWRHRIDALAQVGAWSLAEGILLPLNGVHLRSSLVAVLVAVVGGATVLAFRPRRTDRSG